MGDHGGSESLNEEACRRMEVRHYLVGVLTPRELDIFVFGVAQEEVHRDPGAHGVGANVLRAEAE